MGVGVAYPRKLYNLKRCQISRVSDTKEWVEKKRVKHNWFKRTWMSIRG